MRIKSLLLVLQIFLFSCGNSGVGERCTDGNEHTYLGGGAIECESGLICSSNECLPIVGIGDSCACKSIPGRYESKCDGLCNISDAFCETRIEPRVCRYLIEESEPCFYGYIPGSGRIDRCADRLSCNDAFDPTSCQPLQPLNGRCAINADCEQPDDCSVVCMFNRCTAKPCSD